ncbi:hypothetical protein [Nocardioides sp.]|uniref:hypothetical protein n=1 Tax=Nocardioides sp. TaxID=35761 RepID=UPI0039E339B0
MTLAQLLRAALRRWYVVLVGVALTAAVALPLHRTAVTYWGEATLVVLLPKGESTAANSLLSRSPIAIASLAVQQVNQRPNMLRSASSGATLVGIGERSGTLVQLRNTGVQWLPAAALPYIDIEAVGVSEAEVEQRITTALEQVRVAVADLQQRIGVPSAMQVFTEQRSPQLSVEHALSNPKRALAGTLLAGAALTAAAVVLVDRMLLRLRLRLQLRGGVPRWDL